MMAIEQSPLERKEVQMGAEMDGQEQLLAGCSPHPLSISPLALTAAYLKLLIPKPAL